MTQKDNPFRLIELYIKQDKYAKSLELLDSLETDLDNWRYWFFRSRIFTGQERLEDAVHCVKQAIQLNSNNPWLFAFLATLESKRGNLADAETALLAALREKPDQPDFITQYAVLVAKAGQLEKADRLIQKALQIEPDSRFAIRAQSVLLHLRGDEKAAIKIMRQFLEKDPENLSGKLFLGQLLSEMGQIDEAHRHVSSGARQDPGQKTAIDSARILGLQNHWFLWPMKPLYRFDSIKIWFVVLMVLFVLMVLELDTLVFIVAIIYLAWVIYTWIVYAYFRLRIRRFQ